MGPRAERDRAGSGRLLGGLRLQQLRRSLEGAALLGRLTWRVATVAEIRSETPHAKTLALDVPEWPGHAPGQHVDIRLTADDGYQAQRSYSIASAPGADALELTIERIDDGEVSPYLTTEARVGDQFELRGPIGGYFVWDGSDSSTPVLLVGGGSGLVPLMAMLRHRRRTASGVDTRLLLSARMIGDVLFRDEIDDLRTDVAVHVTLTRGEPPPGWDGFRGRVNRQMLATVGPAAAEAPDVYVCGPTPFVEEVARLLVELGHDPQRIRTERFGPSGG